MATSNDIDKLVNTLSNIIPGGNDLWPLKPSQLLPYIDLDQASDFHLKIKDLKRRNIPIEEVANIIKKPSIIRHFISNVACTGLKSAKKLKIGYIDTDDSEKLVKYLIDILYFLTPEDPFCINGTNRIHTKKELGYIVNNSHWNETSNFNKNIINTLSVDLVGYIWSIYWPYFPSAGYETYGPYNTSELFGSSTNLLIKRFYNLKPIEVWNHLRGVPYNSIDLLQIYNTKDINVTFSNRILSDVNLPSVNTHYAIKVNGRNAGDITEINAISKIIEHIYKNQTDIVNGLSNQDKLKQGAKLSYYMLKPFYMKYWDSWFPESTVDQTIKTLGDKFIKKGIDQPKRDPEELRKIFDPRNEYLPL